MMKINHTHTLKARKKKKKAEKIKWLIVIVIHNYIFEKMKKKNSIPTYNMNENEMIGK